MANTVIQLKFSNVTATPVSLNTAEPAYSFTSNTLFIGSPAGTGAIAIGGKFYLDQQQDIYNSANAAFAAANSAGSSAFAQGAFNTANASFNHANAGFQAANSAGSYANSAFVTANNEAGVNLTQNNSITAAFTAANSAGVYANGAFAAANAATATDNTQNTSITAAFTAANSAGVYANGAFTRANNSINANTGGTITGSLTITGNLTVQGNTTFVDTEVLTVEDSLIKLANNNTTDAIDIGFYGQYDSSGTKYAGLARNAGTNNFFLFKNLTADPAGNTLASGSVTAANAATLIANVSAYSITIGGQDIQTYVDNAFNKANAAFDSANSINGVNVTQNNSITAAFTSANSAGVYANGAFAAANTADNKATSAGVYANGAFLAANTAQTHANYAFNHANAAFDKANTDFTTITTTAGYHGNGATIASFTLEANGRISQANSTLIGISASQVTVGTLPVARGGTGAGSFTTNGVLLGQGTSAFTTASSSTEGHVLTINDSGVPTFAHLSGGTF